MKYGQAHGHTVQLADGRFVVVHESRYPYEKGDVRARISHDEGQTWSSDVYHLSEEQGYAGSAILDDDTLVTVLGNSSLDSKGNVIGAWKARVVRWKLPDSA